MTSTRYTHHVCSRMLTYAHVFYDMEDEADELDKVKRPSIASEER